MAKKNFEPHPYGKFYLTNYIAKGGMAEIYRAKSFGIGGFEKIFALKRILPHLSEDEKFLTMLTDEARLTVQLNHKNIVQVFDFGQMEKQYYLSMELVEGLDLINFIEEHDQKKQSIPVDICCYIASQVAEGLHYAHNKKDGQGRPLKLIHRDISPHNVLLSYDGEVKITDFGIAKATSNLSHTQTGTIKGKACYLAPEQLLGKEIDGRCDIFANGLVLYEMLMGKRLFDGNSQVEVLGKINATHITPEMLPSSIPEKLRFILGKALAYDCNERYSSATDFAQALRDYLSEFHPGFHQSKLADYFKNRYKKEILTLEKRLEPPISRELKETLIHFTGENIMAKASESKELLEKTLIDQESLPGASATSPAKAFWLSSKAVALPLFFISFILFIFSDFLKPLISLAPFFFLIAGGMAGIIYLSKIKKYLSSNPPGKVLRSKNGEVLVFASLSIFVWGLITLLSFATPTKGVLASNIGPIATLQAKLLKIGTDIEDIKTNTKEIKSQTTQIAKDVTDIKKAIENLESTGGEIIDNPKTPQDFYHNARIYALEGRTQKAITAYEEFLKQAPDFIDAHESFQSLLNNTAGHEQTKRKYNQLLAQYPDSKVVRLMTAKLSKEGSRIQKLKQLIAEDPQFAPAYFELGDSLFRDNLTLSTTTEIDRMKKLYEQFKDLDEQGYFKRYYVDKEAIDKVYAKVKRFYSQFEGHGKQVTQKPMRVDVQNNHNGTYSITIIPMEQGAKEIYYSVDDPENLKSSGKSPWLKDSSGQPMPNYQVIVPGFKSGTYTIYSQYKDRNGELSAIQKTQHSTQDIHVLYTGHKFRMLDDGRREISLNIKSKIDFKTYQYSIDNPNLDQSTDTLLIDTTTTPGSHTVYIKGIKNNGQASKLYEIPVIIP